MIENKENQISTEDLEFLFSGQRKKSRSKNNALSAIKYSALFLLIALFTFVSINYQALYKEISFWYHNNYKNELNNQNISPTITSNQNSSSNSSKNLPVFSDNHIYIPTISIDAPIIWMVQNNAEETGTALQNGVIHLAGTATPGTIGNVFITGHSSNYAWAPGKYKSVFALLNKLSVGDVIYLKYHNSIFEYKVYEQTIIKPSDTSVLDQGDKSKLTVMTCTPVGTSLNRLIIKANQIYPDPKYNTNPTKNPPAQSLPEIR